jgi:hypothetical protein
LFSALLLSRPRLAQVHTHPSDWTGHSRFDDARAYSQRAGAVSIVLPSYARGRPAPSETGIHIRDEDGWRQLTADEAAALVELVPSEIDLRGVDDDVGHDE